MAAEIVTLYDGFVKPNHGYRWGALVLDSAFWFSLIVRIGLLIEYVAQRLFLKLKKE